ncbi:recombinase family protein, partial [Salmonella enterica subsp. enterica serovar Eko]|nr:recombinase family protein [Salmonella enterica subsp. enterica serovar Eko]
ELKLEKKTSFDKTLLEERNSVKTKIQELNNILLELPKVPVSVLKTINNLEERLQDLEEKVKYQDNIITSEKSFDINVLKEIQDPQELNMMLKRVIENIIVFNIGRRWRIKILYRNKHSQSFIWDGNNITFVSDTKKLLELVKHTPEESK